MSHLNEAIYSRLAGYSGLTALVGTKICAMRLTEGVTGQAVAFEKIDVIVDHAFNTTANLLGVRYRFHCYGTTSAEAIAVAEQLRACLDGFIGTILSVRIWGILFLDNFDGYDPDAELYDSSNDFRAWHTAT